jgi:8-oxo-dGTP pyrophosphatase MutT (NUDIX family)
MAFQYHIARLVRRLPWLMQIVYHIHKFIQSKYTVGVVAVVINDAGKILLVEHVFHPYFPWGLPGGWTDRNEDPQQAIERELMEELELRVTVRQVLLCQRTKYNHLDIAFLCEPESPIGELSYELLTHRWHTPDDLPSYLYPFHQEAILKAYTARSMRYRSNSTHVTETAHDAG